MMQNNVRPESMERITTPALAEAFIAEQVEAVRAQVGDKKVLLALSGGVAEPFEHRMQIYSIWCSSFFTICFVIALIHS